MGGLRRFVLGNNEVAINAVTQAYLDATGITETTSIIALDYLVTSLINANIWNKYISIYPFVGTTAFMQSWDLKRINNTDRLFFQNGGIWDNLGYDNNNGSGYAVVNFSPASAQDANNMGVVYCTGTQYTEPSFLAFYVSSTFNDNGFESDGVAIGTNNSNILTKMNTGLVGFSEPERKGVFTVQKTGSVTKSYKNGIEKTSVVTEGRLSTGNYAIQTLKYGGAVICESVQRAQFTAFRQALTDAEVLIESNIISEYNNKLSRKTW